MSSLARDAAAAAREWASVSALCVPISVQRVRSEQETAETAETRAELEARPLWSGRQAAMQAIADEQADAIYLLGCGCPLARLALRSEPLPQACPCRS